MPKTAKTIFGTTEKSNFILNMTPESYYGFNLKILLGVLLLMPLFCIPLEFLQSLQRARNGFFYYGRICHCVCLYRIHEVRNTEKI